MLFLKCRDFEVRAFHWQIWGSPKKSQQGWIRASGGLTADQVLVEEGGEERADRRNLQAWQDFSFRSGDRRVPWHSVACAIQHEVAWKAHSGYWRKNRPEDSHQVRRGSLAAGRNGKRRKGWWTSKGLKIWRSNWPLDSGSGVISSCSQDNEGSSLVGYNRSRIRRGQRGKYGQLAQNICFGRRWSNRW